MSIRLKLLLLIAVSLMLLPQAVVGAYSSPIPRAPEPAKELTVIDVRKLSSGERLFAVSVQGLVNRTQPRIFVITYKEDLFWLDVLKEQGRVTATRDISTIEELTEIYRDEFPGLVVIDPEFPLTTNIATMICAVRGFAIATPRVAEQLSTIPVKADLRGRWKNPQEAYRWAYDNLWKSMSRDALAWCCPSENFYSQRDYFIQHKLWTVWISGVKEKPPVHDTAQDRYWTERMMKDTPPNIPIFGFPAFGLDLGIGEMGGTAMASAYAKYNVCSSLNTNLSVYSGYPPAQVKQNRPPTPELDPGKAYVAFIMSDGDNMLVWNHFYQEKHWKQRPENRPPIAWSIGPTAALLMPEHVRYYYRTAAPGDTFITDVSGAGYAYPAIWGVGYGKPELIGEYVRITRELSVMMDINTLSLHDYLGTWQAHMDEFTAGWPELTGIYPDYTRSIFTPEPARNYKLKGGLPVMHSVISFFDTKDREARIERTVKELREAAATRPAFINGFVINWWTDPEECAEIMRRLGDGFVAVTPDALAELASQRLKTGEPELNLALTATACSNAILKHDSPFIRFQNDRYACDGSINMAWDPGSKQDEYLLSLTFRQEAKPRRLELIGYGQENGAPKSFDILLDGRVVKSVKDLRYENNLGVVELPGANCRTLGLRILDYYGEMPMIRELRVFE